MTEIPSQYNYMEILTWIEKKGVDLFGTHFHIVESDIPIIYRLISYFLRDAQTAFQFDIDLAKGILLAGPVGCGKTSIMNVMKYLAPIEHKFNLKPCRDVSFEFIKDGYEIIHRYSKGQLYKPEPKIYCFDDLGIENNFKYYGNDCNVMAEVLLSRYDLYTSKKIATHITSNLSASEIEQHYGLRVRSRLKAMVNLIAYDRTTQDKR